METYENHKIRVTNGWFSGDKLYVDGEFRDNSSAMIQTNKNFSMLLAKLSGNEIMEVYGISIAAIKIKNCVNGGQIWRRCFLNVTDLWQFRVVLKLEA